MAERTGTRPVVKFGAAAILAVLALVIVVLYLRRSIPLLGLRESHVGYFAPVWDPDGRNVYVLKRETTGDVSGFGWESFTPPARVHVQSDRFKLLRIDSETGDTESLHVFEGSPLVGRVTKHYRGRIFNAISAKLEPTDSGIEYVVRMNVPRVPRSETWQLAGVWNEAGPTQSEWVENGTESTAPSDSVLMNSRELIAVPGEEAFPAAIVTASTDGTHRVLIETNRFEDLYPNGVPASLIAERSRRSQIERGRELFRVHEELVEQFKADGMNEGEALLRAHDAMVEQGYYPKPPQVVASRLSAPPAGLRVFEIPQHYFDVGLFQDIAKAIAAPGEEVPASTGTYLVYNEDRLGPDIREWIEAGNEHFVVETGGELYRIEIRRFD